MMKLRKGFTLIELVMVIVILGLLAAIVVPQFIDLQNQANQGALQGVAGTMASAMAVNYVSRLSTTATGTPITDCNEVGMVLPGGVPSGYAVKASVSLPNSGATGTCTVVQLSTSATAAFIGIGSK